jgi:hypothetical protein
VLTSRLLPLGSTAASPSTERERLTSDLLIPALLHEDLAVRTAAASLAFNVGAEIQKRRTANTSTEGESEADLESEVITALVEAISREETSEDICAYHLLSELGF